MLLRIEHLTPTRTIVSAMTYNRLFTLHGVIMVFLFLIPAIPNAFGNFVLPLMLGAKDVAFPRLNLAELLFLPRAAPRWCSTACSPTGSTPAGRSTRRTARSRRPRWSPP